MSLQIHILPALEDNYIYALTDREGRAAVIDPGAAAPVENFLRAGGFRLEQILCTHHHWDHIDGVAELVARHRAPVWCSAYDLKRVAGATRGWSEGEVGEVLGSEMRVLEVPGHTLGQICYWLPKRAALFVGDTLFSCGCGRLFEGTHEQMFASLAKIKSLPAATDIYFGHEYTLRNIEFVLEKGESSQDLLDHKQKSSALIAAGKPTSPGQLATELRINPFLRADSLEEFKKWRDARDSW